MAVSYQHRYLSDFIKSRTYLSNIEKIYAHHISNDKKITPHEYNKKINDFIDKIGQEKTLDLYFNVYPHWIIKNRYGLEIQRRMNAGVSKAEKEIKALENKICNHKDAWINFVPIYNSIEFYKKELEDRGYEFENDFGVLKIRIK